jgi:NAD(P)-dependent dehydrogenase (short-subunit alcohol dehydrogenase family)
MATPPGFTMPIGCSLVAMGVLDGKAVVVTGAGRGLGRAFAVHAARSGASVVVNDIDGAAEVAEAINTEGGTARSSAHSVADPNDAEALIAQCVAEFGRIDGLVNNAGLRHAALPWEEDAERIRALIDVNVLGPLYCGTAAIKRMHAQRGGAIVNIASLSLLGQRGAGTYSASKGAVASMTVSWAMDLVDFGVRANAVCPLAWTRMAAADPTTLCTPDNTPDRMAPLVTYLLSPLSENVTGQVIRFAGRSLHIVRQPARKQPVLKRESWDVPAIAEAFESLVLEDSPSARWSL